MSMEKWSDWIGVAMAVGIVSLLILALLTSG